MQFFPLPIPPLLTTRMKVYAPACFSLRKDVDRPGASVPILPGVGGGELPGPGVGVELVAWLPLVAPGKEAVRLTVPTRHLPLGLGGQPLARPPAELGGVVPRHMDHGVAAPVLYSRALAFGMSPVGSLDREPPWRRCYGLLNAAFYFIAKIIVSHEGVTKRLRLSHVAGGGHKLKEIVIAHFLGTEVYILENIPPIA